jgi:ectoine hydroxylase-related dioxygenase (phytanoyl-CoA dioxygenase family)
MYLSYEQVRFFRQSGYIRLVKKAPLSLLDGMRSFITAQVEQKVPPFRLDSHERICRLDAITQRHSIFQDFFCSADVLDPLESLLGPNIELVLNRHNHATLNLCESNTVRLHRDVLQWSRSLVTAILYLDDSNCETGCTCLIPGSHYLPFVGRPNNGGTWMDEHSVYADLLNQAIPIPMEQGTVLLFDSLVFHTVGENKTQNSRMSICVGYHSVDELQKQANPGCLLVRGEQLYRGNDAVRS